jgi:hypothetical protein
VQVRAVASAASTSSATGGTTSGAAMFAVMRSRIFPALAERERCHVTPVRAQHVEQQELYGRACGLAFDLVRLREVHARLQPREARAGGGIHRDDLAVEDGGADPSAAAAATSSG